MRDAVAAAVRSSRAAGRRVGNDHILTAKRHDLGRAIHASTVIPCRDPTSGIRHPFDLGTPAAPFKRRVH